MSHKRFLVPAIPVMHRFQPQAGKKSDTTGWCLVQDVTRLLTDSYGSAPSAAELFESHGGELGRCMLLMPDGNDVFRRVDYQPGMDMQGLEQAYVSSAWVNAMLLTVNESMARKERPPRRSILIADDA